MPWLLVVGLNLDCGGQSQGRFSAGRDGGAGAGGVGAGGSAGTAGASGSAGAAGVGCTLEEQPVVARQESASGFCLASEVSEVVGCENPGEPAARCQERIADGSRWWSWSGPVTPRAAFRECVGALSLLPPPCFAARCPNLVSSTCDERATRGALGCGEAGSDLDANCCDRPLCAIDEDCGAGERCEPTEAKSELVCRAAADGGCLCAGGSGVKRRTCQLD